MKNELKIASEMYDFLTTNMVNRWYPYVLDKVHGGYNTNYSKDWAMHYDQPKMIVTQARHIWSLSKLAEFTNREEYVKYAIHGFEFLKNFMWDDVHGGFYQVRSKQGGLTLTEGWMSEKRAYGNAFALYGLSALYRTTKDKTVLELCKNVFNWLIEKSYDPGKRGFHQFFTENNETFDNNSDYKSNATDKIEVGYKDQNSSIHVLEAFTEYFHASPDEKTKTILIDVLKLIRDVITTDKGFLGLFFDKNWNRVNYNYAEHSDQNNYRLDHVSFGHDYETAFLMLEASFTAGIKDDSNTLIAAKKMVDHAIQFGWDNKNGGFFDEGYYFKGDDDCTIVKDTKNWWAQAEALNILLMMSKIFPEEKIYFEKFCKQWDYVKNYLLDEHNGDWYEAGLDMSPEMIDAPKSHIWKGTYHTARALMNSIAMLDSNADLQTHSGYKAKSDEMKRLTQYWKDLK